MFAYPLPTSVTTDVNVTLDMHNMTYGETSQAGFLGEDFNDATSSRFDGGDSAFSENVQEKCHDLTPRTISPSVEGQHDENDPESDDSSRLKEVTI